MPGKIYQDVIITFFKPESPSNYDKQANFFGSETANRAPPHELAVWGAL